MNRVDTITIETASINQLPKQHTARFYLIDWVRNESISIRIRAAG